MPFAWAWHSLPLFIDPTPDLSVGVPHPRCPVGPPRNVHASTRDQGSPLGRLIPAVDFLVVGTLLESLVPQDQDLPGWPAANPCGLPCHVLPVVGHQLENVLITIDRAGALRGPLGNLRNATLFKHVDEPFTPMNTF
jgi:hypothetical protein